MSILIKGMEMPTSIVLFDIHPDGKVFAHFEGGWREYNAIPVPTHGRLIDADALLKEYYDGTEDGEYIKCASVITPLLVSKLPTIIPADMDKEDT